MMLRTNIKPATPAKMLGELPVGAFLKDMRTVYNGEPVIWRIADKNHEGYPENSVTLFSYRIIGLKAADAMETLNPTALIAERGNGRYILSNIRAWANSDAKAGRWFSKTHEYDESPAGERLYQSYNSYDGQDGFMASLSPKLRAALMPTAIFTMASDVYGGGMDECVDKIFLPSAYEMGLGNDKKAAEGAKLAIFADTASRIAYPTEECVAASEYSAATLDASKAWQWWTRSAHSRDLYAAYALTAYGTCSVSQAFYSTIGFRPFCNIPADTRVSVFTDTDGAYILFP